MYSPKDVSSFEPQSVVRCPLSSQMLPSLGMILFKTKPFETFNICFSGSNEKTGKADWQVPSGDVALNQPLLI